MATQEEQRNPQDKERERGRETEELIMSQTLKPVLEEQEAVLRVCGVGGGRRVTELGVNLVALRLAGPGEFDFGRVIDDDVIARAHVERSQAIDEKLCRTNTNEIRSRDQLSLIESFI